MKKIFYFIASAIVALGAVACQNEIEEGIDANTSKEGLSFTAVIDDATRIALGEEGKTAWDGDDTIVVKYNENNYEFTNTEENPNTFTCTDTEVMEIVGQTISATYSYNKDGKIDSKAGFAGSVLHCEEGTITAEGAEITMVLTNSLLYFTAAAEVTFTSSEAIFVVDGVAANELTVAASEDVQYVAVMPTESTDFAYLSNGAIVKSLNGFKFGVATKYNLGTLTSAEAVATVNGVKYATLDKAIEAAIAGDGVVEMAGNVELDKLIAIDGEVTIDGSGIISAENDVFKLMENANITIGTNIILESANDCAIFTSAGANNVTVTLNGTARSSSADYAAVQFNGGTTGVTFTLGENGFIEQTGGEIALMLPAGGDYTINGDITGGTGIYLKGGNLTINGGSVTANGTRKAYEHMGSGAVSTGDAVVVESCDYPYAPATLTINGGVFDSDNGAALAHYVQADKPAEKADATISVKGGLFYSDPTAFVAEGYAVVKDEDTYTVKTLAEAITNGANVILPNGTYELTSLAINDKTFSLTGESKDGVIIQHLVAGDNPNHGGYTANVTFNNLTFKNNTDAYGDILANKVTYNECIYIGTMVTYSPEVYVNDTAFVPAENEHYNVHIYGEGISKFTNCSFTTTASRSVYAHAESTKEMNITFTGCTFETLTQLPAGEWRFHPAIRLHTESPSDIYGTLTIKDTEIIGENTFGNTYNDGLWVEWNNNTKERTSKFVTTVDGVDVTYVRDYTFDEENNTYFVYTPDGLVEVFNIFEAGATINIVEDLDMTGKTITAVIGKDNKGFQLNGSSNTISNLKGTQQGLFVNNTGSAKYYFYDIKLENCSVESSTNYAGLFVGDADTCDELEIVRCEVIDCTVESGKYAAALVAYTSGYNVQSNGPVYSNVTIEDCTVTGGSITGGGSTAAAVGHSGGNADTTTTIENLTISGVAINGEDAEHTGIAVGTANVGKTIINDVTYADVTGNYNAEHPLFGRFVPNSTGALTIDGVKYVNNAATMEAALDAEDSIINIKLIGNATYQIGANTPDYYLGGAQTQQINIEGDGNTVLTFNNTNSDWNYVRMNNDNGKISLKNLKLTNTGYNDGPWNRHDIRFFNEVALENVSSDKSIALLNNANLKTVSISDVHPNNSEMYALWITAQGQTVDIDGLTVVPSENKTGDRGIAIKDEYVDSPAKVTLNIKNSTFTTQKKAAILVTSNAGAKITASNLNITNVAADNTNAVWVDEDYSNYYDYVTVNGCSKILEGTTASDYYVCGWINSVDTWNNGGYQMLKAADGNYYAYCVTLTANNDYFKLRNNKATNSTDKYLGCWNGHTNSIYDLVANEGYGPNYFNSTDHDGQFRTKETGVYNVKFELTDANYGGAGTITLIPVVR